MIYSWSPIVNHVSDNRGIANHCCGWTGIRHSLK